VIEKVKTYGPWSLVVDEEYVRVADVEALIEQYLGEQVSMRELSERVIPELREVLKPILCPVCFGQVFSKQKGHSPRPTREN
jgi:hypothetical protein